MAGKRRIVWSSYARIEVRSILDYWNKRNHSILYSRRLRKLLNQELEYILAFPYSGKLSEFDEIRFRVLENYLLFYELKDDSILILSFWDARQNPDKLSGRLE